MMVGIGNGVSSTKAGNFVDQVRKLSLGSRFFLLICGVQSQ